MMSREDHIRVFVCVAFSLAFSLAFAAAGILRVLSAAAP
jgi:hypothetical protein